MVSRASSSVGNQYWFRHSSRNLPLERFDMAVLHGPTRGNEVQRHLVLIGPLAQHLRRELGTVIAMAIRSGGPHSSRSFSSTRTTRSAGNEASTSMTGSSRVYASSIDNVRNLRPPASASCRKSIVQVSFGRGGESSNRAGAQTLGLCQRLRITSFSSTT